MDVDIQVRQVLPGSNDFKKFWKEKGPFKYALTSDDYPPVLMEPEEWIFSNDLIQMLKAVMNYNERKMKVVRAPFNPKNKSILRPEKLSTWKINNFPEEWNCFENDIFVPEGHLTRHIFEKHKLDETELDAVTVEKLFFDSLQQKIELFGYHLFKPEGKSKNASIQKYVSEWEADEKEAGLL